MSTVCILGSTGMLGHSVVQGFAGFSGTLSGSSKLVEPNSLLDQSFFLDATDRELPEALHKLGPTDYVINCIGVIKPYISEDSAASRERALLINSIFPYTLDSLASDLGFKIIQIATDCVFSGVKGKYLETDLHDAIDTYGKTKSLGEVPSENMMNLRVSIIGPEAGRSTSLFEWVRNQPENSEINGYSDHYWNGVTSTGFARICRGLIENNGFVAGAHHLLPSDSMTKFNLVTAIANKSDRNDIKIIKGPSGNKVDRTLATTNESLNAQLWANAGYPVIPSISELVAEIEL
jgi:dTDP-4-dehydrorhamnose reductase